MSSSSTSSMNISIALTNLSRSSNNSVPLNAENQLPGTSSSFTTNSTGSSSSSVENISTVENGELSVFTFIVPNSSTSNSPSPSPIMSRHNSLNLMNNDFPSLTSPYHHCNSFGRRKFSSPASLSSTCSCAAKTSYIGNGGITCANGSLSATSSPFNNYGAGAGNYTNGHNYARNNEGLSHFSLESLRLENPYQNLSGEVHGSVIHQPRAQYGQHCHHHCYHDGFESNKSPPLLYHHNILNDRNYLRLLPRSGDDLLLRSLEKGVLFPVVHWSSKCNENLTHHNQFGPTVAYNQGIYKELKRVIPSDIWLHREKAPTSTTTNTTVTCPSRRSTWLIIGYKSLEKTLDSTLEATWKDWTGVRHIYLNLRHDFEICKISFLHRVYPQDNLDLFMYIVMMEIGSVDEKNTIWLLDFVQRMRVERMKGFVTVYSEVEHEISSIDDEYSKYVNEDLNRKKFASLSPSFPIHTFTAAPNGSSFSKSCNGSLRSSISTLNTTPRLGKSEILLPPSSSMVDHSSEINGNLRVIEKLLEEIHQQPIGDYF